MYGDEDDQAPKGDIVNYALMTSVEVEPSSYEQACINDVWLKAMEDEISSIKNNDT